MRSVSRFRPIAILPVLLIAAGATADAPPSGRAVAGADNREFVNSLNMKFVRIEPGEFDMGSPDGEAGRFTKETQHRVVLTKPYYIGAYHVTRAQFARFVAQTGYKTDAETVGKGLALTTSGSGFKEREGVSWKDPGFPQADDHPVVMVSWNDAQKFIEWVNAADRKHHCRLPTEAEWEYAARGGNPKTTGTTTAYFWGDDPAGGAAYANVGDQALRDKFPKWPYKNFAFNDGYVYTAPVGKFKANPLGLYDMIGNAWQWCYDVYEDYPGDKVSDPTGPTQDADKEHVLRGGSWYGGPSLCRVADREGMALSARHGGNGFRVALDAD